MSLSLEVFLTSHFQSCSLTVFIRHFISIASWLRKITKLCKTVIKTLIWDKKTFVFGVCSLVPGSPPHEHCKAGYQRPHTHTQTKQLLGEINFSCTGSWVHLNGVATVWCPPCLPGSASLQWLPRVWNRNGEVQECTICCEEWTIPRRMQEHTGPFFDAITNIACILLSFVVFALAPQECTFQSLYSRKVVAIGRNKGKKIVEVSLVRQWKA